MRRQRHDEGIPDRIVHEMADFAERHIASNKSLSEDTEFPRDIWRAMGDSMLLGVGTPKEHGGQGLGYPGIAGAGRALARHGGCLGITLSWLMHQIVARFFMDACANSSQRQAYLPAMALGSAVVSIAISEPGVGGHPKHLRTHAEAVDGGYRLTGEKTFLTNGPIADAFIVFAVSGQEQARKRYSAFIVPRQTPGLIVSGPMDLGFLRPCPHGGITLDGCTVREVDILGRPGSAYEDMALPFRDIEDAVMTGPLLGAQEARFSEVLKSLQGGGHHDEELMFRLGGIRSGLDALELIMLEVARGVEEQGAEGHMSSLVPAFRVLFSEIQSGIGEVVRVCLTEPAGAYHALTHDLDAISGFAGRIHRLRQIGIGRSLLAG